MEFRSQRRDGVEVLALQGRLDTDASASFEAQLGEITADPTSRVLIDFHDVSFITSSGLRVVLAAAKRLKAGGGELCVCRLRATVAEVFDISGFSSLVRVFGTLDEAIGQM